MGGWAPHLTVPPWKYATIDTMEVPLPGSAPLVSRAYLLRTRRLVIEHQWLVLVIRLLLTSAMDTR